MSSGYVIFIMYTHVHMVVFPIKSTTLMKRYFLWWMVTLKSIWNKMVLLSLQRLYFCYPLIETNALLLSIRPCFLTVFLLIHSKIFLISKTREWKYFSLLIQEIPTHSILNEWEISINTRTYSSFTIPIPSYEVKHPYCSCQSNHKQKILKNVTIYHHYLYHYLRLGPFYKSFHRIFSDKIQAMWADSTNNYFLLSTDSAS